MASTIYILVLALGFGLGWAVRAHRDRSTRPVVRLRRPATERVATTPAVVLVSPTVPPSDARPERFTLYIGGAVTADGELLGATPAEGGENWRDVREAWLAADPNTRHTWDRKNGIWRD